MGKDPSLRALGGIFLRLGNLTFGGGEPTMAALFGAACTLLVLDLLHPLSVLGLAAVAGLLWREPS